MNAMLFIRSQLQTASALAVLALGAIGLTTLRLDVPGATAALELILFGWLGVALGRLALRPNDPAAPAKAVAATTEKIDQLLRSIARLIQSHLNESEAYSQRLDGASARLSEHEKGGPLHDIVMTLIADNRDMQDRLSKVRTQLEDSRLEVLRLQHSLVRSEEAGMRDIVTMVGNRRFFEAAFAEEIERTRRTGSTFCLALGDLDRFKRINDRFGHLIGDRVLRLFAEILVHNVRGQDRVARFGGEEFAILLPGVELEEAAAAVDRIRGVLEAKQWTLEPSGERIGKVTVSFGVGKLRPNETGAGLLQRVDANLYQAKARGRNRIVSEDFSDEPRPSWRQTSLRAANE